MLIIVGGVYYVMAAGARYFRVTNATIDVQRSSLAALARLTQELGEGDPRSLGAESNCLVFASPRDSQGRLHFDASSRLVWQKFVTYYWAQFNGAPCLLRKERAFAPTTTPPSVPPLITSLRDDDTVVPAVVSRNIAEVSFSGANPVDITVTARIVESEKEFEVKLSSRVTLKN
jgi:hypothetical protein